MLPLRATLASLEFGHFRVVAAHEVPLLPQTAFIHAGQPPTNGSSPSWQLLLMHLMMNSCELPRPFKPFFVIHWTDSPLEFGQVARSCGQGGTW